MWKRVEDELPPLGKFVLVRYNGGNWGHSTDQENCNCMVMELCRHEAPDVRDGEYYWDQFGPDHRRLEEISHWMEIPECEDGNGVVWRDRFKERERKKYKESPVLREFNDMISESFRKHFGEIV